MGQRHQELKSLALSLALLLAGGTAGPVSAQAQCQPDQADLRGDWGRASFSVEVADEQAERNRGLMFRESLPRSAGMLFVYPAPRKVGFWMKNTLIPLDMIFIDRDGIVQQVHNRAQPHDTRPIFSHAPVYAVLEINGGLAETLGIDIGTQIRHPVFAGENAAWPC